MFGEADEGASGASGGGGGGDASMWVREGDAGDASLIMKESDAISDLAALADMTVLQVRGLRVWADVSMFRVFYCRWTGCMERRE